MGPGVLPNIILHNNGGASSKLFAQSVLFVAYLYVGGFMGRSPPRNRGGGWRG